MYIIFDNEAYETSTEICIVMELVDGGSLTDIIVDKTPFPEPMIAYGNMRACDIFMTVYILLNVLL